MPREAFHTSNLRQVRLFQSVHPTVILPMDIRRKITQEAPRDLVCNPMVWNIENEVDVSKLLDIQHPILSIVVEHVPCLLGCLQTHRRLLRLRSKTDSHQMTSSALASAKCAAEDPCSLTYNYYPESPFAAYPRSTTLSSNVWKFWCNSEFLK